MSLKSLLFGRARSLADRSLFHQVSLIAVFAWVGLGADGLSSSCYGPEETFKALGTHPYLAVFVAIASVVTIVAICASYSQIIALFPSGGGGYLVASKLLSPGAGVVSGSALLIDYVLTITISVASGADAVFSMLPPEWLAWKLPFAMTGVFLLTGLNLRGVRESVLLWVPVFFVFVATHAFVIVYSLVIHGSEASAIATTAAQQMRDTAGEIGIFGLLAVLLKAYSLGAGTYTGIEAVSNGLPILREPRVETGRRTMLYMGASLALTVAGLLLAYLLFAVAPQEGKTLNAVLLGKLTAGWPEWLVSGFLWTTMASEAALLFIAAQAGFLDGPRVLASMALDRWFPTRFANLSDRFVTQNGIVMMGAAALLVMVLSHGSVALLVVLYSINVFITFTLSQAGMVRHWWQERGRGQWKRKLAVNGFGLALTSFILISLSIVKFHEGGWVTLLVTGVLVAAAFAIKRHYRIVSAQLQRLEAIVAAADVEQTSRAPFVGSVDRSARTAIVLVNGYNGLGLHTVLDIPRNFGNSFQNYAFIQVGAVDAGNFKGAGELDSLRQHTAESAQRYAAWANRHGYGAAVFTAIAHDIPGEVMRLAQAARDEFPNSVFFAGQLLFQTETRITRLLHNYTALVLQRRFLLSNLPFVVLPIRVEASIDEPIVPAAAT